MIDFPLLQDKFSKFGELEVGVRKCDDLKAEYILIQGLYESFDQRALSMKALATPLLGAGIAFGVKEGSFAVIVATTLVAASLWVLEAMWKGFQYSFTDRIKLLEAWFRNDERSGNRILSNEEPPYQIYTSWNEVFAREKMHYIVSRMFAPFVCLPYIVVVLIGISLLWVVEPRPSTSRHADSITSATRAPTPSPLTSKSMRP